MHSSLIPIINKQRFDYSFLSGTTAQQVTLAGAVDLTSYKTVFLMVRIHRISLSAGQSFVFTLENTLPSEEDPQEFTDTSSPILSVTVPSVTSAPKLLSGSGSDPLAFGKVVLTANQGSSSGTPLYAEMSVCLLGRSE